MTPDGPAKLRIHLIGPHPILLYFLDKMTFWRIVASCLGTPREGLLDHAQTLATLIQNIILSPAPLYRIAEWSAPIDAGALGLSAVEKLSINDDRVARSLDALASSRARSLFFRLALHIIKQFELNTERIHQDTTTITFSGEYRDSYSEPRITHGHNKDHRPDLKQLVFGLDVTSDGAVPISHDIYSGNRTDDTIHCGNVNRLREILGRDDFIYVADSKLCTKKNLEYVSGYGGKFVTILPRSRAEDKKFRKTLRDGGDVRWRRLLEIENKRRKDGPPDIYWTTSDGPDRTTEGYRIIWCRSSQKSVVDSEAREALLRKTEAELRELSTRVNRGSLRKKSSISKAAKTILRTHNCQSFIEIKVGSTTQIQTKRLRPGRPKPDDPVKEIKKQVFHLEMQRDREALKAEARTDGVFPLVSNLTASQAPKKEILLIYKYQPYVEKRHSLFKTELGVAPVYLKKPSRVAGMVHAVFLAMTLDALIERALRQGMKREGLEALPILPEGRMTKTPTTARLLEIFSDVSWYEFEQGGEIVTFPIQLSQLQKQLLRLLEIDQSAYC